jgi:hypothetical protein
MSTSTAEFPVPPAQRELPRLRGRISVRSVPIEVWLLCALTVAAAVIRLLVIDNQSIWFDESLTAHEVRLPFTSMLKFIYHEETTPPLYFVAIWVWAHVFGDGEVALRMLSTLCGIALVPVCYLCAKELVSRWAGVVAATIVAFNPFLIWYSQEARSYMLLTLLSAASFLYFIRARARPTRRNVVLWGLFSCLAITTHFFAGFLVAPEALWLLWLSRTRLVLVTSVVAAVVQVAMLPLAVTDTGHGTTWIGHISHFVRLSQAVNEWGASIMYRRASLAAGLVLGALMVALVAGFVLASRDPRTREGAKVSGLVAGAVWLAPFLLGYLGHDYFLSRNLMPAVGPVAVLLGVACSAPRVRVLGAILVAALLSVFGYAAVNVQSHPYLQRPNWRSVARALGSPRRTRAILATGGSGAYPLTIYLRGVGWLQPQEYTRVIREVDVVGATKPFRLVPNSRVSHHLVYGPSAVSESGATLPERVAPRGAILISRFHVHNWVVARFLLRRPLRVSIEELPVLAPQFFIHAPRELLSVIQSPAR